MDPFEVMARRGHIMEDVGDVFTKTRTHTGANDDYDQARGPSRSLTARSDKQLTQRDMRMPMDLSRSRRAGLHRDVCTGCGAVHDQGRALHAKDCAVPAHNTPVEQRRRHEVTGPMLPNETSADVGWR